MDANNSNPTAQQSVILTLAVVLLCRAMWKFLHRVDPDAPTPDHDHQLRISSGDQRGSARASIDATTTTVTINSTATTPTTTDDQQEHLLQHQRQSSPEIQDLNNNSETDVTPPDTVDGTVVESPFLKNLKQNKIAQDERDAIQKKTFTKWVNKHLIKVTKGVVDLFEDLRDGNNLISLLEILSGETLAREKGKMRVHQLQNVRTALKFLTGRNIKLVNIRPDDIVDGNPKLTLGLIWTIILHFQLSDIILYDDTISFKEALLKWARKTTEGYPDVNVKDFTHSWKDGLAFNAILHRNRPDLLDYRSCGGKSARENLEHAFSIYESLGVTRLLDPEDVDCKTPDEKSLITYISSLYELFPEPPENNPLLDNERLKQIEHYKKLAENLVCWLKESTRKLNDRTFPATTKEMKRLQEEAYRFRSEEIPPHHADKQLLCSSYKEILKMALALPVRIEEEYKAESIETQWSAMMKAFQERDRAIKDHLARLGDLESVAEKLRRNIKECDRALDSIAIRVYEEAKQVHKVNPLEPNYPVEQLEKELKYEEERIISMLKDAKYLLEEGYPKANELHKQVLDLQQRHAEISLDFKTKVLDVLEDRRAKAQRKPLTEAELIASNPSFRFLHECIEWCKEKGRKIAAAGFGTDVFSVTKQLDEQRSENSEIAAFQTKVDRCDAAKSEFEEAEVLEIYVKMLGRLHKLYAELKGLAGRRLSDLEALLELLREVDQENKWTEDVIAPEVIRNWSSKENFNLAAVEEDHRKLYYEIQSHEHRQEAIVSRAERLLRGDHPARESIDAAVNGLLFKKKLLVEEFNSLDEHKRAAADYHRFHAEVAECRSWLEKTAQTLNSTFSVQNITFEEGDQLNREMLTLKDEINRHRTTVTELESRAKSIHPLKLRTSNSAIGGRTVSLVSITGQSLKLSKGEQLTLRDNADPFNWKVATRGGEDYTAANLCFSIPPPDQEAIGLAGELKRLHEELISLWAAKHHELRQNMLLATIRSLKSWDYPTYCSKDPAQRDAIINALANDIDKVVSESAPGDRKSQQLLDEFADLKRKFAEFEARRKAENDAVALQKLLDAFVDSISGLLEKLQEKERIITKKLQEPIPRKVEQIKSMVLEHKDFEVDTRRLEPAVEKAKAEYAKLPKSPVTQPKYEALIDCWNKIWTSSNVYIERLKALEIVLRDIDDAHRLIANFEIKLSRAQDMPAELEQARAIFEELKSTHGEVQRHSASFDKLLSNVSKVRRLVERSRLQQSSNADIDRLEEDVKALHKRWDNIGAQIGDRIKSLENCHDLLKAYRSRMDKENSWFKQTRSRLEEVFRRRELNTAKQLYEDVSSHKSSIEDTNSAGSRFMKEARIYDLKLKNYREQVAEQHPSIDASAKRSKMVNGIETVTVELKSLNDEYKATLDKLLALLNQLQDDESKLREFTDTITFENITAITTSTSALLGAQQVEVATTSRTSSTSSTASSNPSVLDNHNSNHNANSNAGHDQSSCDNGKGDDDEIDTVNSCPEDANSDDSDEQHSDNSQLSNGVHQNGHSASAATKVQIYHQKSTIATGSKVPLDDSTFSANSIVSTVNVTQNIKSAKVAEGVTEITINRVYETAVKNSTCIVKSSKVIGTKFSAVGGVENMSSSSSSSSSINSRAQQAQEYFEDRLSEHEEYEEQENDEFTSKQSSNVQNTRPSSTVHEPKMAQLYEQFEAEVENLQREQSFIEQQETAVSLREVHSRLEPGVITTTVLNSQPVEREHYGETQEFEPKALSEQQSYSQFSTVTSELTPISSSQLRFGSPQFAVAESASITGEKQRVELLSSTRSKSYFSGSQSMLDERVSPQTIVTSTSSFSSSVNSYVSSYVTSSSAATMSSNSQSQQATYHQHQPPLPLLSSILPTSSSSSQYLPTAATAATVSVIQTDDRVAKGSISINFAEDCYVNLRTDEVHSIGESIQRGLLNFKVQQADGSELLLSECVQEDGLLVLPSEMTENEPEKASAMSFSELVTAGLLTAANCTLMFAGREIPLERTMVAESQRRRSSSASSAQSESKAPISSSTLVEPNFPSVLTISSEEVSRETAKVLSVAFGNFAGAATVDVTAENELTEKLFQWLVQKERLISDLGPICSEPRALASQLQQVQTMKEDFAAQSPLLNKMDKLGDNLLERLDSSHPEVRRIKSRRQEIHEKYAALTNALSERERNLLAVKDAATAFQTRYERLLAALHKISDDFERIVASGADNEEQLLKLSNLEENLDMQRPAVADLEGACERLVDLLTDAASKSEVRGRVANLRKLYEELAKKITDKKAELQSHLKEEKDFHYDCDAVQDWLRGMTTRLAHDFKVSALLEKVTRQVAEFEPLYREVLNKEHEIHILLSKGAQLQRRLTRPQDVSQLTAKMEAIKRSWATLKEEATSHHTKLQKCLDIATRYNGALSSFLPWLKEMEAKVKPPTDLALTKTQLEKVLREFQLHKSEIARHSSEFENVCSLGESLIAAADVDTEIIRDQLNDLKRRWSDLQQELGKALETFEKLLAKLNNYSDKARDLGHGLGRLDDKLNALNDKDPKQLEKIRAMVEEAKGLGDQLENVKKVGFNLIDEAGPGVDSSPIRDELRGFDDKFGKLNSRLADANRDLEKASKALNKYNASLAEITRQLTALEEKFDRMAPIGRTVKVVEQQIDEMTDFNQKLVNLKGDLKQAEKDCSELIANGFATDPSGLRNELNNLVRKHDRLSDRAAQRTAGLQDALDRLKALHKALKENLSDIKSVQVEVDAFKPISRDVETIRAQKAEFQQFNRSRVEPLAGRVASVTKAGSELIQSAPHGVSTAELEGELAKHGDQWNELKNKLSERERRLDQALLQAGRFKDALSSVEKWLMETEEMVRNQKPPSSDYVALKAQLQEQRYLMKMLTDRQQSIEALQELGKEFMANLERGERAQIEKQLADIDRRFNALMANAEERMKVLEACLPVAKEFAERIVPLQEWLQQAARRLNALQSFSVEQEKLSRRIGEHKAFHQEVVDKGRDFNELANVAQRLIYLVQNEEEGQQVTGRLADITDKYAKLVEDSLELGRLLADSYSEIGKFMSRLEKITNWLADTDARLNNLKVLSINPDKLAAQTEELADIVSDVNGKQSVISEFVTHGQQLLNRFGSANDSMFIRSKVEAVQSRYNDLRQRANDRLEQARTSLNLAQKFYAAHDQLNGWMDEAEERLASMDGLSLHQQNSIITGLENEVPSKRRLLETVTSVGAEFARTSSGQNASTINGLLSKAARRFDAIVDQLTRRAEKLRIALEQNAAMGNEVDELLDWFRDAERQLLEAEPIVPNYEELLVLLRETKSLNDDINSQRGRVREVVSNVKRLMREGGVNDDLAVINGKADELKELAARVSQLAQDRLAAIEHALPLVEHFFATHQEISAFLDEVEAEVQMLATPSIYAEQIRKQQEATKRLIQTLASHKPLMERLNKTGAELIALLQKPDARQIQQIIDSDNERYNRLRGLLREHQNNLETALQATSQFSDKLDGMLNALNNTHDQLKNAEPISAHVPKIKEQIADNNAIRDDLAKREGAFNAVKAQAKEVISKAGKSDEPAIRDIRNKLDRLNDLWNECQRLAGQRGANLDEALKLAVKFWNDLANVMRAIKELEDTLNAQEPPAVEPAKIQQQQAALAEIRHDMERTKPEVEKCKRAGQSLMKIIGEQERPEVRKNLEDLDSAWDNVTALYARREKNLIDAMEKAMNFHEKMKGLQEFLDKAEERLTRLGPIAADIEAVKRQIGELKQFKGTVDPHMVEVEALNRMAHELLDRVPPGQARGIRDAVADINRRWKDLLKAISDRQSALDNALLKLGQFQQALNELLAWIAKVERVLDEAEPVYGDPQVIEVELAKHKVLMNDIHAHQASVDSLNVVGKQLIDSEAGGSESARNTRRRLDELNKRWATLLDKANGRTQQLEDCLRESQCLAQEIADMLGWLNEIDGQISTSKPVGGLPETAREQLNRFMEVYNELDMARHKVEALLQNGEQYVGKAREGAAQHLSHNLKVLKTKWENILSRANDRKIKLEIALKEATEFHEALQAFVDWLTGAEKYLSNLQPVSRVLDNVLKQIEEHKHFQKDIGHHRETMLNLDKKGTHLKYFSQKQDVTLIKNLLASVQHRWERVLTKAAERARALDHGFKEAKEFYDSWADLISWLEDAERTLDSIQQLGNNPDLIKQTLYRHKEFQRQLGAKQSQYDSTMRFGKGLKEKCPREDVPILQEMLDELKNKWNAVCQKSVDKQRKLEEALLFSGQFKDAIQALIEWLEKARQLLAFDQPVHGDLDTVNGLIEGHKNFIEDFNSRESNLNFVRRTAADLVKSANPEDARQIKAQMDTLEEKWSEIERMTKEKQVRLADALKDAERLHQSVHALLEWLSDAELKLRFAGPLPEDEAATRAHLAEHENFLREMKQQELSKNTTLDLAREILSKAHPNAAPVIKHWITIIQSRWDEVESWANQRAKRLNDHLKSLKDSSDLLGDLLGWLAKTEADLMEQEAVPLPDDVITLEKLIDDHQRLIDELNDKQVDVERVVKAYSVKKAGSSGKERPRSRVQSGRSSSGAKKDQEAAEMRNPKAKELLDKWQVVWKLAMERMKRLKDSLNYNREIEKMRNFDFDDWRRRFLFFMEHKKARMMDFYKRLDKDSDGRITKTEFIDGVLNSRFGTNRLEMERVADIFDMNGDRYIDQKEYLEMLRPDKEGQPKTESEIIQDEVQRQVGKCTCMIRYKVYQVGEGKYRFGDSQKLRLVRILRSTVMVRVGGGWVSLEEFLTKNDPCRARGRTNVELREQFVLADGVSQSMTPFKAKAPSPFKSDGTVSLTGPISKIREKTERSIPMSQGYRFGNLSNDSDQEDLKSRPRSRLTPSSSRANSRPGSRQSSQPPSRTASDMSAESLDGYNRRLRAKTSGTTTTGNGTTGTSAMARTPSFGSKLGASSSSIGPRWK